MPSYTFTLLKEIVALALLAMLVGYMIHKFALVFGYKHDLNDIKVYLSHVAMTAILIHLLLEVSGGNHWYCYHGAAVMK